MQDIITDKQIEKISVAVGTVALAVAFVKFTSAVVTSIQNKEKLPPIIPYKIPFIGSTREYYKNPSLFAKTSTEKYGPVFRMHLHGELVTVVGAEDAPEVYHHPNLSFTASQFKFVGDAFFRGITEFTFPNNAVKDIIMKHLTPNLKDYSPRAFELFLQEADHIKESEFTVPELLPFLKKFVSRYSASAFVGLELYKNEDLINAFENAVTDIGKDFKPGMLRVVSPTFNKLYMRFMNPKMEAIQKYRQLIQNAIEKEIYRRKESESGDNKDILEYILKTYPHELDTAYLQSITTVILILIFVGVHTTSDAVTYVLYYLVQHPEYIQELRDEQEEALAAENIIVNEDGKVVYTPMVYRRMVKLDSFIRESLRMRMVGIGHGHTNISDHDVVLKSGAVIAPGQEVFINLRHIHIDPENQKGLVNLEKFDGFRFVGLDKAATKAGHDNASFGMGKHACPGRWFATHQIKGLVSYFIRNYDMSAVGELNVMDVESDFVGSPQGKVRFSKRK